MPISREGRRAMRRWRRRTHGHLHESQPAAPAPSRLPDNELDAFLAGCFVEWAMEHGPSVPAWAWMNRIAHGSMAELEAATDQSPVPVGHPGLELWGLTSCFLARELLATATDDEGLHELQQRVLVPVELDLAKEWWRTRSPKELATVVLAALHDAQRR
jgi:hypothetical protein